MDYYEIYNSMELPRLGCGLRRVFLTKRGYKNCEIFYPGDVSFHQLSTATFDRMVVKKVGSFKAGQILNYVNSYSKSCGIKTRKLSQLKKAVRHHSRTVASSEVA
jgi:hypothetical protein